MRRLVAFLVGPLGICIVLASCGPTAPTGPSGSGDGPAVSPGPPKSDSSHISDSRLKEILGALDLSSPGLLRVKEAGATGDKGAATRELASYFRSRKRPSWRVDTSGKQKPNFNRERADAAAEGRLVGGLVAVEHVFPGGNVDWMFNATKDVPGVAYNQEWQVQLNRMNFWADLGKAYLATGEEKYAKAFASQMTDWVADCPVPAQKKNDVPSTWRTIEAGIRMGSSWPDAFYTFLKSPSFTDADIVNMLGSFLDHARYLRANPTVGNWLAMEMAGLYTVGALFPEFSESADWRKFASSTMARETGRQFLPDGGQVELTPGYHNATIDNMLAIIEAARITDRESELPPDYLPSIEKAFDYNLALLTPDRSLPRFNDSWPVSADSIYRKACRFFPERNDFRWALNPGGDGTPPPFTSRFLDWSGYAMMRSGWSPMANYLVFDVGPLGFAHVHQDKLNLVLWAYGREILFDSGGASYERSKWRDWSLSTAAHNCILVDGFGQNCAFQGDLALRDSDPACVSQKPIDAGWISSPVFDYAKASFDQGFGPSRKMLAKHQRQVLFLKPNLFIVADSITPADELEHTYEARWHLLTTNTQQDKIGGAVVTTDPGLPNLAIIPLLPAGLTVRTASAEETPQILGWNTRKDMVPPLVPATTVLHSRKGSGPQYFLTLLVPLKTGQENPVTQVDGGPETLVTFADGRQLRVSTKDRLSIQELLPDGSAGRSTSAP